MAFTNLGLAIAQSFIAAQLTVCPLPSAIPKVNIYFFPKNPTYITEAPAKALTAAGHGKGLVTHMIEPKVVDGGTNVRLATVTDDAGNTCFAVSRVDMVIHYIPTVFIAQELSGLPCHLAAARAREEKHIALDHKVFRDYIPKVKMEILWYLRGQGMQGPFTKPEAPQKSKIMIDGIQKAMQPMIDKMVKERARQQSELDLAESDFAETGKCAGEEEAAAKIFSEALK